MGIGPFKPDDVQVPEDLKPKDQNAPVKKMDGLMMPPLPKQQGSSQGRSETVEKQIAGKPSTQTEIEQFRKDWTQMGFSDMCIKYDVSLNEIMQWAKELL